MCAVRDSFRGAITYFLLVVLMVASGAFPEQGKTGGWMVYASYLSMGRQHDYSGVLRNVSAPVLVIHGAKDLQPEEVSRRHAAAFPNSQVCIIRDAGHFSFHTQPAEFGAAVAEFLDQSGLP
jgi:pimeloyl-ACP methyl ester carboxylesterase